MQGAYNLETFGSIDGKNKKSVVLVASGSEVAICVEAAVCLHKEHSMNVQLVSFPSFELFEKQPIDYKKSVFPVGVPVLSVEASSTFGWSQYAHFSVGIDTFGASGPYKELYEKVGITCQEIVKKALSLISFYSDKEPSWLMDRMRC